MSLLTKILMGLVVVAVLPVMFFSAAVLRVNQKWRVSVSAYEKAVDQQEQLNFDKLHGDAKARVDRYTPGKLVNGTPGVLQYEVARDNLKLGRGRFWYVLPIGDSVDEAAGKFKISVLDENVEAGGNRQPLKEHNIKDRAFLYLFQLKHDGSADTNDKYLGEFVVDGLTVDADGLPTDNNLPLKPSLPLTPEQWNVIKGNANQWLVYEHMPIDDHDVYSDLSEDDIRARLPDAVEEEYLNDAKAPTDAVLASDKLKQFVIEDKDTGAKEFLRPLRDYQQIFRNLALRTAEINDRVAVLKKEKEYADRAKVKAEEMIAALKAREVKLQDEKKLLEAELTATREHGMKLDALLAQLQNELQTRLSENKRLAEEIAGTGQKTALLEKSALETGLLKTTAAAAARTP